MSDQERKYVLRSKPSVELSSGVTLDNSVEVMYYTGKRPTKKIREAKLFTLKGARGAKQFSHTGAWYEIIRVTDKQIFEMTLKGK